MWLFSVKSCLIDSRPFRLFLPHNVVEETGTTQEEPGVWAGLFLETSSPLDRFCVSIFPDGGKSPVRRWQVPAQPCFSQTPSSWCLLQGVGSLSCWFILRQGDSDPLVSQAATVTSPFGKAPRWAVFVLCGFCLVWIFTWTKHFI